MYDRLITQATNRYLPDTDWRLFKAQLIAESNLNPVAESPVGALGIAQFMPRTWASMARELDYPSDATPMQPGYAIPAAAYYMSRLIAIWSSPRPDIDRYCLALASYNAGIGNLLTAQGKAGGVNDYRSIIATLPRVTGSHADETINYVKRIFRIYLELVTG